MINWGSIPLGTVLPFPFASYAAAGESITLTGLAVTDVEVYKGVSMTQRSSDAGYALLDTDGIDIDGVTGIHAFSIDTGDNTDAGFFVAGSLYWVVVSAVTVDGKTVSFLAGSFRLVAAEDTAGYPKVTLKTGTGTGEVVLTSGQVSTLVPGLRKNVASQRLVFFVTDATSHAPLTGLVDGDFTEKSVSIDGAAPSVMSGTVTEIGGGYYYIDPTQAETNGNDLAFVFDTATSDPCRFTAQPAR